MGFYASGYVSALGKNSSGGSTGSASALYQLADVVPNSANDGVLNAANGSVLMYNGTKWQAGDVVSDISTLTFNVNGSKLFDYNGKSAVAANLTVPTKLSQLTDDVVSGKYLPLSGGTMSGNIWLGASTSIKRKMNADTSNYEPALQWYNADGSKKLADIGYYNTVQRIYFNPVGSNEIYNDAVGKYSLVVGNNLLTWNTYTILHSNNYNSYTPTLTGTGASGTWPISITGNAATATKWAIARTLTLTGSVTGSASIDGSGNVSLATTTNHTHDYLPLSGGTLSSTHENVLGINSTYIYGAGITFKHKDTIKSWTGYSTAHGTYIFSATSSKYLGIKDDGTPYYQDNTLLHAGNYNSYAPTLTGTGASGTWGISITGKAVTSDYSYYLRGRATNGTYYDSSAGNNIIAEWNTKSDNRWYLRAASTYECRVDYATSSTNADMLDNVHYQNILEREFSGYAGSGTSTGWFRIAQAKRVDSDGICFILAIQRSYNYTNNEAYTFSISISYTGGINITQLSGYANSRLITKIRVDYKANDSAYIDLYISASSTNNNYNWYTIGCAESYTSWTANPTLVGATYEFTTVNGCKSDKGFTGDITGNASSATKLQTARTIWGQSFDGTGNISGDIIRVGSISPAADSSYNIGAASSQFRWIYANGVYAKTGSYLGFGANNADHIRILTNGNVGIGTTSPSVKLHVIGDIAATGAVTAKASSSDIRLKTDISDYKALSIIRGHKSIKYHWNAVAKANADIFNDDYWHYGLIAQDVQRDMPQMVSDVFKDYLVINYERLIPICWKGLQEVDDEVTKLKKKVRKLEMEIRELKQKEDRL